MTTNYIDQLEQLVETVSYWAVSTILETVQAISPTGRGLFQTTQSDEEMVEDYMQLRGNAIAWGTYIMDAAQAIEQKLVDSGLGPDDIASVHPFDIAQKYALAYSADMEAKIDKLHGTPTTLSGGSMLVPPPALPTAGRQSGDLASAFGQ